MLFFLLLTMGKGTAQTLNVQVGQTYYQIPSSESDEMVFKNGETVTIMERVYQVSEVNQMYLDDAVVEKNTVKVFYEGAKARVLVAGGVARYLTVKVSGAHVSIEQSSDLVEEITYELSGSSDDGEFYMSGSYKAVVELNGLTLTNPSGAAINIQNGKRIDVSVQKDTENTLTDGANGTQKACLVIKGHAEFKGKGVLNVNGLTAHAIKTGEYMTMKNCTINVKKAVNDGVHASEYFLMSSGTLNISGVGGDALQAEIDGTTNTGETADHEDEDSGNIYIEGGTLTLTTTGAGKKCLKSDSTVVVTDGLLTLNASGDIDVSDATDPSYVAGVKAGKFVQNGGTVNMTIRGTAGRGVSADDIITNGGELNINNSAAPQTVSSDVKSAKGLKGLNVALNAGTINITMTGDAGKGITAGDGTKSSSGGGGWFAQQVKAPFNLAEGPGRGARAVGELDRANGPVPAHEGNAAPAGAPVFSGARALEGGFMPAAAPAFPGAPVHEGDSVAVGSPAFAAFAPGGGGPGGGGPGGGTKYTDVTGSYTQGLPDGTGPTLTVTTTGSAYSSSSAKAIKAICAVTIYGGTTEVRTSTNGAEGMESKTSIDIKGGNHYLFCYDDCINTAGKITFDGGVTVCYSNGNDAVDSNAGTAGAITIGDGTVFAYTTKGAPEEGIDCDNNSYIQITGTGICVSAGAAQGGGGGWGGSSGNTISNVAQGYAFVTNSVRYEPAKYYTLSDASGNNLVTYSFAASCSSSLSLFTAPGMVKGSTYYIKSSTTEPTDAQTAWHGLYIGSTAKGTTQVASFTAK